MASPEDKRILDKMKKMIKQHQESIDNSFRHLDGQSLTDSIARDKESIKKIKARLLEAKRFGSKLDSTGQLRGR